MIGLTPERRAHMERLRLKRPFSPEHDSEHEVTTEPKVELRAKAVLETKPKTTTNLVSGTAPPAKCDTLATPWRKARETKA